jgi:FkbM family methyltransferase
VSAETLRWKRKALRHENTATRLKAALERADSRYQHLHARLERRRQHGLDHSLLRAVLPIRAAHPPLSAAERREAQRRDEALQASSTSYREEICGDASLTTLARVEIDGLPWWIPVHESCEERIERSRRQGFPYRAILQTREIAIGGFMLDVGANLGRTSIPRVLLGDVRAVYAAEPEPANYACLVRNVAEHGLRGFVLPDRVAIGASRGEGRMRRSRYPGGHRMVADASSRESIVVQVWPLDEWVAHLGIDVDAITFIKSDTQGCEVDVLRGAPSLVARRHISWLIEVDPALLRRAGTDVAELLALLEQHFSSFIDIGSPEAGPRVRPTAHLSEAVSYLGTRQTKTDLLLFHGVQDRTST